LFSLFHTRECRPPESGVKHVTGWGFNLDSRHVHQQRGAEPATWNVALPKGNATNEKDIMKKLTALLFGCLLSASFAVAGEPSASDQKWLQTVEKMVIGGEKKVSTPNEGRVSLLKEWAAEQGYSIKVTKTETGYSIEVTGEKGAKRIAQK
jgi:hypothetical protein